MHGRVLALNNHRMYLEDQDLRDHLGLGEDPQSMITGLLNLSRRITLAAGSGAPQAGVQFGTESQYIMEQRPLLEHLRRESLRLGVEVVPHHPDSSTPGSAGFVSGLQLALQRSNYLGSSLMIVHPSSGSSSLALRETVLDLTAEVLIRELARSKVVIALENLGPRREPPCLGDLESLASAVKEIRRVYASKGGKPLAGKIGICLDYGHLAAFESSMGRDLGSMVERILGIRDQVVAMHIHINDGSRDQHILLGERPKGLNRRTLEEHENLLLRDIVPRMTRCRVFVLERNSPYRLEELSEAARLLASAISEGDAER